MRKRRFTKLICTVLILIIPLTSCSKGEYDVTKLLLELCGIFPNEYGPSLFYSKTESEGFKQATASDIGRLYTGLFEEPNCFPRIEDFAIRLPLDDSGFEIHILKCVNISDTEEISSLLMQRINRLCSSEILEYAPESYERYFRGAEIFVKGRYVFLLATPDNTLLKKEIKTKI